MMKTTLLDTNMQIYNTKGKETGNILRKKGKQITEEKAQKLK